MLFFIFIIKEQKSKKYFSNNSNKPSNTTPFNVKSQEFNLSNKKKLILKIEICIFVLKRKKYNNSLDS